VNFWNRSRKQGDIERQITQSARSCSSRDVGPLTERSNIHCAQVRQLTAPKASRRSGTLCFSGDNGARPSRPVIPGPLGRRVCANVAHRHGNSYAVTIGPCLLKDLHLPSLRGLATVDLGSNAPVSQTLGPSSPDTAIWRNSFLGFRDSGRAAFGAQFKPDIRHREM